MARDSASAVASITSALRTFSRPWPLLLAGLACTAIGLLLTKTPYVPARLLFLAAGLLLAGSAVSKRLQTASWKLEDRIESAGLLAAAAALALLSIAGIDESWDSGIVFLVVLGIVGLFGSFLVLLPQTARRIAASILVVLHFGGILTAVTAVPPRNDSAPWLSMHLWTVYRPYLTFAYLTNAYHFYSPDPGPPTLMWYHVEYQDGSARWIKLPNHQDNMVGLHFQRLLAAGESTNNPGGIPLTADQIPAWEERFGRAYEILPGIKHDPWETIQERRFLGATLPYSQPIQMVSDQFPVAQYYEPQEIARRLIASYARHIARTSPHPQDPEIPVEAVRVYRVTHNLISPHELSQGVSPTEDTHYSAIYVGQYDVNGKLLDPKDPFLYWYLPIMKVSERYPAEGTFISSQTPPRGPVKILNCVEIHASETNLVRKKQEDAPKR
jgi:hypothetical protein